MSKGKSWKQHIKEEGALIGCSQIPKTCLSSRKGQERKEKGWWRLQTSRHIQQRLTLNRGALWPFPENKMAVITGRKMEILGVLPVRAWNLGWDSAMKKLGLGHLQESEKAKVEAKAGSVRAEMMVTRVCVPVGLRGRTIGILWAGKLRPASGWAGAPGPAQLFGSKAV